MDSPIRLQRLFTFVALCLFLTVYISRPSQQNSDIAYNIPDPECTGVFNLCTDADKERLGRQAILAIHEQMDDDKDGIIAPAESTDFLKVELETHTDAGRLQKFQNLNIHITFDDLWAQWQHNPVYNWTTEHVIDWLVNHVDLPEYAENFRRNQFDGRMIPRLAINEKQYLSSIMHVRDIGDKRRLIIKSLDVVLFGPPHATHQFLKDVSLISALFVSVLGCIYAFVRQRQTQENLNLMSKELEFLQQAEGSLLAVTERKRQKENDEVESRFTVGTNLLTKWLVEMQQTKEEANRFRRRRDSAVDHEKQLSLALQEIEQLQIALRQAEEHATQQSYEPPTELLELLRRTHQVEEAAFETKRKLAETALVTAKEQMSRISKMQKGFFGTVRLAHTSCIDDTAEMINAAKDRLTEIHAEYDEREQRWSRIVILLDRDKLSSLATITSPACMNGVPPSHRSRDSPRLRAH